MYRLQMLIHVEDLISMMAGGVMVRQTVFGLKLNFALLLGELLKLPPMPSWKVNKHWKAGRLLKRIFSVCKSGGSHLGKQLTELGDKLGWTGNMWQNFVEKAGMVEAKPLKDY